MESPNPNPSDLSNKNNEETVEPRVQGESSAEEEAANDNNPDNQQHEAAVPQPLVDQDREYGCKYCHKRFSNKQALGGHQNAHKVERAMEKNARDHAQEHHQNHFNYFPGAENSVYPGMQIMNPNPPPQTHHFLDSHNYHRSNNSLLNWPYINSHSQQQSLMQQHHHQVGAHIGYHNVGPSPPPPPPRPIVAPLPPTMTYVNPPPRPLSGFNNAAYNSYPRINNNVINNNNNNNNNHNYPHLSSFMQQNQGFSNQVLNNLRINNPGVVGAGSSSSGIGAGPSAAPGPSTFAGPRIGPEWNPNNPARGEENINLQMSLPGGVDEQAEDPDMDLSLKL